MTRKQLNNLDGMSATIAKSQIPGVTSELNTIQWTGPLKTIRETIRAECLDAPGVYCLINDDRHVTYVGMSKSLTKRLQTYFTRQRTRRKESRIRRANSAILWQPVDHDLIARLRERELIRRFRPVWNVQGHPTQLKTGYIVATDSDAASFQLVGKIPNTHAGIWGPIPHNKWSVAAVEQLNLHFALRDCASSTPMQFDGTSLDLSIIPTCLRADLETCLRPCAGGCTPSQYQRVVHRAKRFLDGRSRDLLSEVEVQMRSEAGSQNFEKAARLRDRLNGFLYLHERLRRFHDWTASASFVFECDSSMQQREIWIIVVCGNVFEIVPKPQTLREKENVAGALRIAQQCVEQRSGAMDSQRPGEFEFSRIMYRWFRRHPDEKKNQRSFSTALRLCTRRKRRAS